MTKMRQVATGFGVLVGALLATGFGPAIIGDVMLQANLSGGAEVPGPGDADGSGTVSLTLKSAAAEACYEISVEGVDQATEAHIHRGMSGKAGPPVITLSTDVGTQASGCVAAEQSVLTEIADGPSGFYVNVHSSEHPQGAVRGQLAPAPGDASAMNPPSTPPAR
jgi:hypothetical protein